MNGDTEMPTITFGECCTYDMLDSILNSNPVGGFKDGWGWGARVWLAQGVIITALWGKTDDCQTSLLAWSEQEQDYCKPITVPTDDITRLEIL